MEDYEGIAAILIGGLIILTPIAGLTLRFALKPLIDSLVRLAEIRSGGQEVALLKDRVALLEQEVDHLRDGGADRERVPYLPRSGGEAAGSGAGFPG